MKVSPLMMRQQRNPAVVMQRKSFFHFQPKNNVQHAKNKVWDLAEHSAFSPNIRHFHRTLGIFTKRSAYLAPKFSTKMPNSLVICRSFGQKMNILLTTEPQIFLLNPCSDESSALGLGPKLFWCITTVKSPNNCVFCIPSRGNFNELVSQVQS